MLYLQNIETPQVLSIPKVGEVPSGSLVFKAKSTIDLTVRTEQPVQDQGSSRQYYVIGVTLPSNLSDGEYEYELLKGESVVSTGVLVIGNYSGTDQTYHKEITYEQYQG